jgi:hypothetical protein
MATNNSTNTSNPITVPQGGTGATTLTIHGVLLGQTAGTIVATTAGTTGQVLTGVTGADPSFSATPSVTSITIANAPSVSTDGTNKAYVDSLVAGLDFKNSCYAATTATLNATYANGVAGVGATLINAGTLAAFSVDGQSPAITSRILVKDQASTFQNGIYTLTTVGSGAVAWVLTRALDYDQTSEIQAGDIVPVEFGTTNATTLWLQTATVAAIGTDPIIFSRFLGNGIVTIAGNSGTATGSTVTISGGNNITTTGSASTLSLAVTGTTNHAVQVGNASGSLTSLGIGTTGQILTGVTASDPVWAAPAAVSGTLSTATVTLTSAQVKALHATPITIVAAPAAGQMILVISGLAQLNYGGSNAFVNGGGLALGLYYTNANTGINAVVGSILATTQIVATANQLKYDNGVTSGNPASTVAIAAPLVVSQASATEISGNAAGDNTIKVQVWYLTVTP